MKFFRQEKCEMSQWQVGDKINNRYVIHQILSGGMGIVYVCYDTKFNEMVVLKTMREQLMANEEMRKLFKREAYIWTQLDKHPYIVQAKSVELIEDRLFIRMEYIVPDEFGRNTLTHYLDRTVSRNHLHNTLEWLKVGIEICQGMEFAYSKGIDAHRDLKPDNIMITADQRVKITDFGLAKAFQDMEVNGPDGLGEENNSGLSLFMSKGRRICGTLPYMAPEQFDGYADKRSDIYAFGILFAGGGSV